MFMRNILYSLLYFGLLSPLSASTLNFENIAISKLPSSWKTETTHSNKNLATWEVQKEDSNHILTITDISTNFLSFGGTFNLFYTDSINFKDGEISVDFRANSGKIDQGGGIMWRVIDKNNYYVARFNPLEDNFRFYSVTNGDRRELKSANIKLKKGWHKMKIIQKGSHFEGYLDGKKLLDADNNSIKNSGGVGLWSKADAATSFDNLTIKSYK
jgi:hypothetical protein